MEYAPAPGADLWVAACLGLGGAFLAGSLLLGLGELLYELEHPILEALFLAAG